MSEKWILDGNKNHHGRIYKPYKYTCELCGYVAMRSINEFVFEEIKCGKCKKIIVYKKENWSKDEN
jgi:predicted SprT family Zn-dependent metalloprotease